MLKNIKRMLSIVLILLMFIPSVVMAETNILVDNIQNYSSVSTNITIDYVQKDSEVTISINSTRNRPVSITIKDGTQYIYINQGETDELGKIEFKTTLELDKSYDCQVKLDDNVATKKIYMQKGSENTDEIAIDLYVKGYNGVILDLRAVKVFANETLMDLMRRIFDDRIVIRNGNYVVSIDGQAELDKGKDSGWMYSVNGAFPNVGANSYVLKGGDIVKWLYTENLGVDVGAPMYPTTTYKITTKEFPDKNTITVISLEASSINDNVSELILTKDLLEKAINENVDVIEASFGKSLIEIKPNFMGKDIKSDIKIRLEKNNDATFIKLEQDGKELNKLEKPVKIILPYNSSVSNKDNLTVVLVEKDKTKSLVGGIYDLSTNSVTFLTHKLGEFRVEENTVEFKDLASYSWAEQAINIMAAKGIIGGKATDKFSPADNITRAEFAALISRMLKYNEDIQGNLTFSDVKADNWFYKPVLTVCMNGLINGKSSTNFDPNGNITREEMSKIIGLVLAQSSYKKQDKKLLTKFSDGSTIASWAEEGAAISIYNGVIQGANDRFNPKANATRAEAAVMLYRLYDLIMK